MLQDDHTAGAPQLAITPLNNVAKVPTTHNGEGTRLKNSLTRSREKQVNKPSRRPPRGSQTKNPETTTTKFSQQIPSDIPQAQGTTADGAIRRTIDHLVDKKPHRDGSHLYEASMSSFKMQKPILFAQILDHDDDAASCSIHGGRSEVANNCTRVHGSMTLTAG